MNESLEEFTKSRRAREAVWDKHGTEALAKQVGLPSDPEKIMVVEWSKRAGMGDDCVWRALERLRYVAESNDPDKTRIHLFDLIEEAYASIKRPRLGECSSGTREVWSYEQPLPGGRKNCTKTAPIQFKEFAGGMACPRSNAVSPLHSATVLRDVTGNVWTPRS